MSVNNDVLMIGMEQCAIPFLDCRGYYDLAAEIVVTIIATLTLIKALHNHHELRLELRQANQEDTVLNLRRKIIISLINVVYMSSLLVHLVFSMLLFTVANEENKSEDGSVETGVEIILRMKLNLWYQFTHLVVIQLLNCLVVVIGKLYWNSLNSFYSLKGLQTPFLYRSYQIYPIIALLVFQGGVAVAALVDSIFDFDGLQAVLNWLVLASQVLSTAFFIVYRILYFKNIFRSIKLGKKTVQRQQIYNIIIILTALGRVALCILESLDITFESLRKYDVSSKCHDVWPYHAIVIVFIRTLIDILPVWIFIHIFGSQNRSVSPSNIGQTLFSRGLSETSGM